MKRYFLDRDDSCDWYLVEAAHRTAWEEWLESESRQNGEAPPAFAKRLSGSHYLLTFTDPKEVFA